MDIGIEKAGRSLRGRSTDDREALPSEEVNSTLLSEEANRTPRKAAVALHGVCWPRQTSAHALHSALARYNLRPRHPIPALRLQLSGSN
eukprot:289270-Pleurochrysis_carterae.AAC.2